MSDPFFEAYSALGARMKIVDIVTNNLANVETGGFKRDFGMILHSESGFDVGTRTDLAPGDLVSTGNGLDVAIDGSGFFAIETPQGIRYTRTGSFTLDSDGNLVTKDGMKVLSSSGTPITVGEGAVSIQDGGAVMEDGNQVAALKVVTFSDPAKLEKEGFYRFNWAGTPSEVQDVPEPRVRAGSLERSNVNAVNEMVHLMSAFREFESVQKTLKLISTDMNSKLIEEFGRLI